MYMRINGTGDQQVTHRLIFISIGWFYMSSNCIQIFMKFFFCINIVPDNRILADNPDFFYIIFKINICKRKLIIMVTYECILQYF